MKKLNGGNSVCDAMPNGNFKSQMPESKPSNGWNQGFKKHQDKTAPTIRENGIVKAIQSGKTTSLTGE